MSAYILNTGTPRQSIGMHEGAVAEALGKERMQSRPSTIGTGMPTEHGFPPVDIMVKGNVLSGTPRMH